VVFITFSPYALLFIKKLPKTKGTSPFVVFDLVRQVVPSEDKGDGSVCLPTRLSKQTPSESKNISLWYSSPCLLTFYSFLYKKGREDMKFAPSVCF